MKGLPLPEVTEIKPINQWQDKLYAQATAPDREQLWNQPPVTKTDWMQERIVKSHKLTFFVMF